MNTLTKAAMRIAAIISIGQQFVCSDTFEDQNTEYSGEYLTASILGAGVCGFSTFITGGLLWRGNPQVTFTGITERSGPAKKLDREAKKTPRTEPISDEDREARKFAESHPGYIVRETENPADRLANANARWADGDDEFAGYQGYEKYENIPGRPQI